MKIQNLLLIFFAFISLVQTSFAQSGEVAVLEDVILFNNEPYKVRMTNKGKILAFITDVENNYAALGQVKRNIVMVSEDEINSAVDLARADGNTLDPVALAEANKMGGSSSSPGSQEDKDVMNIDEGAMDDMVAMKGTRSPESEDGDNSTDETKGTVTTNYDYEFAFDHRDATLSPSSVNQLNLIANILKEDEDKRLEIYSYYSETVDVSKILSKNRAKGIVEMLVSKGIAESRIKVSESNNEDWANNRVKVSIH